MFDKYRDEKEAYINESLKLYVDVRKISCKDVPLVTIRDHTHNTLNLAIATENKVVEMRMNLENIHVPDMIHLHKKTREVITLTCLRPLSKFPGYSQPREKIENQIMVASVESSTNFY